MLGSRSGGNIGTDGITKMQHKTIIEQIDARRPNGVEETHLFLTEIMNHCSMLALRNRWNCSHKNKITKTKRNGTEWTDCKCEECGHMWVEG